MVNQTTSAVEGLLTFVSENASSWPFQAAVLGCMTLAILYYGTLNNAAADSKTRGKGQKSGREASGSSAAPEIPDAAEGLPKSPKGRAKDHQAKKGHEEEPQEVTEDVQPPATSSAAWPHEALIVHCPGGRFSGGRFIDLRAEPYCLTQQIGGATSISFAARWDSLSNWSRILDLGSSPGADNITISNSDKGRTLVVDIYRGTSRKRLMMPSVITVGELRRYLFVVNSVGTMKMFRDGAVIGEVSSGYVPRVIEREYARVGGSSWPGEGPFTGEIQDMKIWRGVIRWSTAFPEDEGLVCDESPEEPGTEESPEVTERIAKLLAKKAERKARKAAAVGTSSHHPQDGDDDDDDEGQHEEEAAPGGAEAGEQGMEGEQAETQEERGSPMVQQEQAAAARTAPTAPAHPEEVRKPVGGAPLPVLVDEDGFEMAASTRRTARVKAQLRTEAKEVEKQPDASPAREALRPVGSPNSKLGSPPRQLPQSGSKLSGPIGAAPPSAPSASLEASPERQAWQGWGARARDPEEVWPEPVPEPPRVVKQEAQQQPGAGAGKGSSSKQQGHKGYASDKSNSGGKAKGGKSKGGKNYADVSSREHVDHSAGKGADAQARPSPLEREKMRVEKKLREAQQIAERQSAGEAVDPQQLEKLEKLDDLKQRMAELNLQHAMEQAMELKKAQEAADSGEVVEAPQPNGKTQSNRTPLRAPPQNREWVPLSGHGSFVPGQDRNFRTTPPPEEPANRGKGRGKREDGPPIGEVSFVSGASEFPEAPPQVLAPVEVAIGQEVELKEKWHLCWEWIQGGWCPRGATCRWEHPPLLPAGYNSMMTYWTEDGSQVEMSGAPPGPGHMNQMMSSQMPNAMGGPVGEQMGAPMGMMNGAMQGQMAPMGQMGSMGPMQQMVPMRPMVSTLGGPMTPAFQPSPPEGATVVMVTQVPIMQSNQDDFGLSSGNFFSPQQGYQGSGLQAPQQGNSGLPMQAIPLTNMNLDDAEGPYASGDDF